jgi:hypothetical protein
VRPATPRKPRTTSHQVCHLVLRTLPVMPRLPVRVGRGSALSPYRTSPPKLAPATPPPERARADIRHCYHCYAEILLAAGAMAGPGVTVQAVDLPPRWGRRRQHAVDEGGVTAHAVFLHQTPVPGRDLDRLLEVLQGEGRRVPEPVLRFGDPLGETLVG